MKVTLTTTHRHNGAWHGPGAVLDLDEAQAQALVAAKKAVEGAPRAKKAKAAAAP